MLNLEFPSLNDQPAGVRGDRRQNEYAPFGWGLGAMLGSIFAFFRVFFELSSHFLRIFARSRVLKRFFSIFHGFGVDFERIFEGFFDDFSYNLGKQ